MDKLSMSLDEIAALKRAEQQRAAREAAPARDAKAGKPANGDQDGLTGPSRRSRRRGAQRRQQTDPMGGGGGPRQISGQRAGFHCSACGGVGHLARECPSVQAQPMARAAPAPRAPAPGSCYGCGGPHLKRDCPSRFKVCDNCGETGHLRSMCRKEPVCFRCASLDHISANCPHRSKVCKQCGKVGHLSVTCRQQSGSNRPITGAFGAAPAVAPAKSMADKVCDNCKAKGHIRRDCPQPERCFRCASSDHKSVDCPHKETECPTCNKVGHTAETCRQAPADASAEADASPAAESNA